MDIGDVQAGSSRPGCRWSFRRPANGRPIRLKTMISWGERSISKAILGGNADHGSRRQGRTFAGVKCITRCGREIRDSDLRQAGRHAETAICVCIRVYATEHRPTPLISVSPCRVSVSRQKSRGGYHQNHQCGDAAQLRGWILFLISLGAGADGIPKPDPGDEAIFRVRQSGNEPAQTDKEMPPENRRRQEQTEQTALAATDCRKRRAAPEMNWTTHGDAVPARRLQEGHRPGMEPVIEAIRTAGAGGGDWQDLHALTVKWMIPR